MRFLFRIFIWFLVVPLHLFADEKVNKWEQLFFPYPIVGAPPQLEQQIQIFESYFSGDNGEGVQSTLELAYIATAHLGFVADIPYQSGFNGQSTGIGDISLLLQYLAAGSLKNDNMMSIGLQGVFPTGVSGFTNHDTYLGPFIFAAQRFWKHLIFEVNLTLLYPVVHSATAKQFLANGLVSYLLNSPNSTVPVYLQAEIDSTFYFSGSKALPSSATHAPAQTVFVAPEIFLGPFKSFISQGTRIAAGAFFNLHGDREHNRMYTLTISFDIPNRFGY